MELLVVITIIGILIALLLPAVQAAREAAHRMECAKNEKEMGIAMHGYHEQRGGFPPGFLMLPDSNIGTQWAIQKGAGATWITFLLPFLEEGNLSAMIDWDKSFGWACDGGQGYPNREITSTPLAAFWCPSASIDRPGLFWDAWAYGSYGANAGHGPMTEWYDPPPSYPQGRMVGVFHMGVTKDHIGLRASDITDGLSNTAFVSELCAVRPDDPRGLLHGTYAGCFYHDNHTPNDPIPDQISSPYACIDEPRAPCQSVGPLTTQYTARSEHAGGVNLLLGDGSVRFVSDTISLSIWQAISSPRSEYASEGINEIVAGDF